MIPTRIKNAPLDVQYKYIMQNGLFDVSKLSLETLRLYNGADCDLTKRLEVRYKKEVSQPLLQLYIDLSFVLYRMEGNGPPFDYEHYEKLNLWYPWKEKILRKELQAMVGDKKFNPGSPEQVYNFLYEQLGLVYPFSKGKPNTGKKTLLMLGREHPFPSKELEWRKIAKASSTSINGYKKCADLNNGRLRTRWWLTGTRTGRLASGGKKDDPGVINLQNIDKTPLIRNLCVADTRWKDAYRAVGNLIKKYGPERAAPMAERWVREEMPDLRTFLANDYGQIEVRVAALMSGDVNLKKDCEQSDIHTVVGVQMTGWPAERIKKDILIRTLTKNVHFGILFGIAEQNLYEFVLAMTPPELHGSITREEISKAFKRYFKRYGGVARFIESQRAFAKEYKYVETLFGMKQHLNVQTDNDDGYFDDDERGAYWGNQAVNGPIQGTAHQLLDCGLVNLERQPEKYEVLGIPSMDVHDALDFNVLVLDLPEAYEKSKYLMEHESLLTVKQDFPHIEWDVPIVTDSEAGLRLGCMVDLEPGFTVGSFLVEWQQKCRQQVIDLNRQLAEIN